MLYYLILMQQPRFLLEEYIELLLRCDRIKIDLIESCNRKFQGKIKQGGIGPF